MKAIRAFLQTDVPIEPLITFRILFGALMMIGSLRFMWSGWIEKLYVEPKFFFKFYGFEWVQVLSENGMYLLYSIIALSAAFVLLGLFYRISIITFFLTFTYSELIDVTNYLNHYYLVCLLAFLLIFLPANRAYALDVLRKPSLKSTHIPQWCIIILMLQIGLVYFFAGLAKLNPDWLFRAMPLAVWLPAHADFPILGTLFQERWVAFVFSWFGAFYDLTIVFFLLNRRTRPFAYVAVVVFHVLTKMLFNIGLFPYIMIISTLIFFSADVHRKLLKPLIFFETLRTQRDTKKARPKTLVFLSELSVWKEKVLVFLLVLFFVFQVLFPLRHYCYAGDVLWTEEGYRFSWRVMLVEKNGLATFRVKDSKTGRQNEVINANYLTAFQEKQMSIQPDLILQFAHFLAKEYQEKYGFVAPVVTVDNHVALNGRSSKVLIDPDVNLVALEDNWRMKSWILK